MRSHDSSSSVCACKCFPLTVYLLLLYPHPLIPHFKVIAEPIAIAQQYRKPFFLGEFGGPGKAAPWCSDACEWWTMADGDRIGSMALPQKVLAAINAGAQAVAYWTFMDSPESCPYWGLSRWNASDLHCRPSFYRFAKKKKKEWLV